MPVFEAYFWLTDVLRRDSSLPPESVPEAESLPTSWVGFRSSSMAALVSSSQPVRRRPVPAPATVFPLPCSTCTNPLIEVQQLISTHFALRVALESICRNRSPKVELHALVCLSQCAPYLRRLFHRDMESRADSAKFDLPFRTGYS